MQRNARRAQRELSGGRADARPEACTGAVSGVRTAEICQAAGARMFSSTERCCWLASQALSVVNLLVRGTSPVGTPCGPGQLCAGVCLCCVAGSALSCLARQSVGVNVWWAWKCCAVLLSLFVLLVSLWVYAVVCGQLGVLCCVPCHSLPPRKQRNCVLQRLGGGVCGCTQKLSWERLCFPFSAVLCCCAVL